MPPKRKQRCKNSECKKYFKAKGTKQKYCSRECKEHKSNAGRKWFDSKDEQTVLTKLAEVWLIGATDAEACYYANISTSSLSRYLEAHPDQKEYRDRLREYPRLKARRAIVEGLNNYQNGIDYMERKGGEEFLARPPSAPPLEQHFYFERQDHASNQLGQNTKTDGSVELFNGPGND